MEFDKIGRDEPKQPEKSVRQILRDFGVTSRELAAFSLRLSRIHEEPLDPETRAFLDSFQEVPEAEVAELDQMLFESVEQSIAGDNGVYKRTQNSPTLDSLDSNSKGHKTDSN